MVNMLIYISYSITNTLDCLYRPIGTITSVFDTRETTVKYYIIVCMGQRQYTLVIRNVIEFTAEKIIAWFPG